MAFDGRSQTGKTRADDQKFDSLVPFCGNLCNLSVSNAG